MHSSSSMTVSFSVLLAIIPLLYKADGNPLEITLNNHRGQRFCEFAELNFPISSILWTSLTQHDCPQQIWDDVKNGVNITKYFPIDIRYITRDITIIHFASSQLKSGLFLQTQQFYGKDDPINNMLPFLRQFENTNPGFPQPFVPFEIPGFDVTYQWNKNENIFLIEDEFNNYYIMASTQTEDINKLENILPIQYENILPNNWKLKIRKAKQNIINRGVNGINNKVIIIQDGIGNNFFLLSKESCISCDHKLKKTSCSCSSVCDSHDSNDDDDDNALIVDEKVDESSNMLTNSGMYLSQNMIYHYLQFLFFVLHI